MAFFNKIKAVVQTEGARGIRQVLQKEGTKRFAQDLSAHLDVDSLSFCETRRYGLPALVSAIAVDPVQGLLASGTYKGAIAVTGASELAGFLELEDAVSVKMIAFQPGAPVLIVIDAKNAITVFDLIKRQRLFVRNARNIVTCMELLSGSNWLFHGLKDGTIDVFDVYRGQAVPYRIPNIIPEGRKHSLVVSIKTHPKDNNQLLIAYDTGIALWNLKLKSVIRTFIYEIPPGAMGGITAGGDMFGMNESRYPHVTIVSWRPDGLGFVSGYDDGCFVFWDVRQEGPVLARTIHELNVNVPGIRPVFERNSSQFVPIYQLSWCLNENREDTTLIVAGGTSSIDMYGLHLFEYPAKADYRSPRRQHTLTMDSDILDFVVLPRDSPWFNGALDPVSILVLTNRGGVRSYSFDSSHIEQTVPATLFFVEPRLIMAKTYGQLPVELYNRLVNGHGGRKTSTAVSRIPLRGIKLAPIDESRICRDILVTAHSDNSIRFWEGASLNPLHHLTVELGPLFFKNQGEIVAFEYSVQSEVLTIGFSNGNWIYGQLSQQGDLSRQSSIAKSVNEEYVDEALAASLRDAMDVSSQVLDPIQEQLPVPTPSQEPVASLDEAPQPNKINVAPSRSPHALIEDTTQEQPPIPEYENTSKLSDEALSPRPECLEGLAPVSPVDPVAIRDQPPTGLHPNPPPLPERAPSPSLPPRPAFVESALPNGSEFSPVFKSSSHLGRINQIAVSGCGL
ncbi:WD40-repeat-containing domain protein, partial [Dissophora ornata]